MHGDMEFHIHNLEQEAYGAVLRAFKAQSDALTWEKEGLITELRKELRVSDDEHRELLTKVNADDLIRAIREWRSGGSHNLTLNVPQHISEQLPSPAGSGSRKRQKTSQPVNPYGGTAQPMLPQSAASTMQPLSSAVKWGPGRRQGQPALTTAKPVLYHVADHSSSVAPTNEIAERARDPLVGRKIMVRWPADNNFYEAVINDYNPVDGTHALMYDSNTQNATTEWVDLKEIPPEDIRWVGDDPGISHPGETGGQSCVLLNSERGRGSSRDQFEMEVQPPQNGETNDDLTEIEILHTQTLIRRVEKIIDASPADHLEIEKAKKMLKEHERSLIGVIEKLADACESDGEQPFLHGVTGEHVQGYGGNYHGMRRESLVRGRTSSYGVARG